MLTFEPPSLVSQVMFSILTLHLLVNYILLLQFLPKGRHKQYVFLLLRSQGQREAQFPEAHSGGTNEFMWFHTEHSEGLLPAVAGASSANRPHLDNLYQAGSRPSLSCMSSRPLYSSTSPRPHANKATINNKQVEDNRRILRQGVHAPPHLSMRGYKQSTSPAGMTALQEKAAEVPKTVAAWLGGQLATSSHPFLQPSRHLYMWYAYLSCTPLKFYFSLLSAKHEVLMSNMVTNSNPCLQGLPPTNACGHRVHGLLS